MNINDKLTDALIVPIGADCSVASFCRDSGLRYEAFPFDWTVTPIDSAVKLIGNQFQDFLNESNLVCLDAEKRMLFQEDGLNLQVVDELVSPVICRKYKILFPHDFSGKGLADLEVVRNKYYRRIERLISKIQNGDKVCFIYAKRKPNRWQMKQYAKAGVTFESAINSYQEVLSAIESLEGNLSVLTLDQLGAHLDKFYSLRKGIKIARYRCLSVLRKLVSTVIPLQTKINYSDKL